MSKRRIRFNQLNFTKDIEPIINNYGLKADNGCKEAVELIKKDDPEGYNQLARILIRIGGLNPQEEKVVYAMTEKAFKMGMNEAYFNLGSLHLSGVGVKMDAQKGLYMMHAAFLKPFSDAYSKYPLGSTESYRLSTYLDSFIVEIAYYLKAVDDEDEGEMRKIYRQLCEFYSTILDINENGF